MSVPAVDVVVTVVLDAKLGCMEEIWLKLGEFLASGRNWAQSSLKI